MGRGGVEGLEVRRCERRGMSVRCFSIVPCILAKLAIWRNSAGHSILGSSLPFRRSMFAESLVVR